MHHWVRASSSDFAGTLPQPRSGHSAVTIGKSKVIIFGGLLDKKFLNDIVVYDIDNKLWFQPECTGGTDGQVGPSPRAFQVAVVIDCHMFIFGGRYGSKRLGDFWVLDTDIWQWTELTSFGDLPSARDFAAASAIGNSKIVMYGGWDGKKWLSDVYVLDTISLEWMELSVTGSLPPPRCGHTATMVEKRLLVYGGRGGGGPIMGDLWALKGLIEEENETPGWTQLKLPGQAPSSRCGHTITSGGHYVIDFSCQLLLFGGHGTGGWLSRYDIYYNDCIILDRVTGGATTVVTALLCKNVIKIDWKRLLIGNEPPPARAYHSLTCIGSRHLLFGGFDGKSTFGDLWWLVPEEDPIANRLHATLPTNLPENKDGRMENDNVQSQLEESQIEESAISGLQKRLGLSVSLPSNCIPIVDELEDRELVELAFSLAGERVSRQDQISQIQALRDHWGKCTPRLLTLKELGPLLRDYQRQITRRHLGNGESDVHSIESGIPNKVAYSFYHMRNVNQLRMDDIPKLLAEYKQLLLN